jgi:hypothetical protein
LIKTQTAVDAIALQCHGPDYIYVYCDGLTWYIKEFLIEYNPFLSLTSEKRVYLMFKRYNYIYKHNNTAVRFERRFLLDNRNVYIYFYNTACL